MSRLHLDAPDTTAMQAGPCTDRPQSAHHCFAGDEAEGHEEGLRLGPSELPVAQHSCCTLGRRGWHWGARTLLLLQLLACSLAVQPHILCGCPAFSLVLLAAREQRPGPRQTTAELTTICRRAALGLMLACEAHSMASAVQLGSF